MLNSFASDLDSILSDLSTSPTPAETLLTADAVQATGGGGAGFSGPLSTTEESADQPEPTVAVAVVAESPVVQSAAVDVVDGAEQSKSASAKTPANNSNNDDDNSSISSNKPLMEISLLERLIRSHPVWYLPTIQRTAAAQLLQHEDQGVSSASGRCLQTINSINADTIFVEFLV